MGRIMKKKFAQALLRQREEGQRRRLSASYTGILVILFLGHSLVLNMTSPLKLIPQTASAIGMGYLLLMIISLRQFRWLVDFIDWSKVEACVESESGNQDENLL